jgi:hypothetical protein
MSKLFNFVQGVKYNTDTPSCFKHIFNELSLNNYLGANFDEKRMKFDEGNEGDDLKYLEDPFFECKEKALKNNKQYFLINDFSVNNGEFSYQCYTPKDKTTDCQEINFNNFLNPYNTIINRLFGEPNDSNFYDDVDNCNNVLVNLTSYPDFVSEDNCVKYQPSSENSNIILPNKKHFVIYKTELLDNYKQLNNLTINEYEYYNNEDYSHPTANRGILNISEFNTSFEDLFEDLSNAMQILCTPNNPPTQDEIEAIDGKVNKFGEFYEDIFDKLNILAEDISNISFLTKYDTQYIERLDQMHELEKKKLKNLFGVDGANNGKLLDTKYMKNLKLNEILIISLLLIFLIFIYSKKK